jgi:hypothetical protein
MISKSVFDQELDSCDCGLACGLAIGSGLCCSTVENNDTLFNLRKNIQTSVAFGPPRSKAAYKNLIIAGTNVYAFQYTPD